MPVRIRLQRHGKKGKPFYWIVAADGRAKRDGKFLEKLGIYNPNTNPATIEVNVEDSVKWLQNGAQPSETARRILSYKGVLLKHHLLGGLRKGALTEEQVEEKFNAWMAEKEKAVAQKTAGLDKAKAEAKAKALEAEKEVSEKRALAAVEPELPETPENESAVEEIEALEEAPTPETDIAAEKESAEASADDAAVEEVVETPEVPQPDKDNADTTPVAPVVEKEVIEETEGMAEAPSVEEVIEEQAADEKAEAKAEEE
ncbi:MAG: 30S ribosomal protein S16 [Eudoraea sp.]|nr:30S ribosomal protein S16 [Eudoraea sp.]